MAGLALTMSELPPPPYAASHTVPSDMVTRLPPEPHQEQHALPLSGMPQALASALSACISPAAAAAAPAINEQAYAEACKRACKMVGGVMGTLQRDSRSAAVGLQDVFVAQSVKLPDVSSLASQLELSAHHVEQLRMSGQLELLAPEVQQRMRSYIVSGFGRRVHSVMEVLGDASLRWTVILGSPGSGKSSALRAHLLAWAAALPAERERLDFPVLVELKKYARDRHPGSTLLQYMSGGGEAHLKLGIKALKAMLQPSSGRRVLLLLDGLDEVFDVRLRAQVVEDVQRFVNEHRDGSVRVVLTSRIVGYSVAELQADDFVHFVLQPLGTDQIEEIVRRWHAAVYKEAEAETRKSREERLLQALRSSPPLQRLASNPLLLSMIALVNDSRERPTQRASLYAECSRLLLERWKTDEAMEAVKGAAGMSITLFTRAHKEALLADLAWRMLQQDGTGLANLVPQSVLEAVVLEHVQLQGLRQAEPKLVVQALITQLRERHHVLCWLGGQSFAFVHRTFLEYYAALHLQQQWEAGHTTQAQLVQLFLQRAYRDSWDEVLQLVSGMLPSEVMYPCLDALVGDGRAWWPLRDFSLGCLTQLQKRDETTAAERLTRVALEAAVRRSGHPLYTERLAQLWPDDRTRTLLEGAALHDEDIVAAAVCELGARWPDGRTRAVLEQVALLTSGLKSAGAVVLLSRRWKDDRTRGVLERIATTGTSDASWNAAATALEALEREWGCSLEAMQTADYWRDRGAAEGADDRVRETVRADDDDPGWYYALTYGIKVRYK